MSSFFNDDTASIDIPIRLVVYMILTGAILEPLPPSDFHISGLV